MATRIMLKPVFTPKFGRTILSCPGNTANALQELSHAQLKIALLSLNCIFSHGQFRVLGFAFFHDFGATQKYYIFNNPPLSIDFVPFILGQKVRTCSASDETFFYYGGMRIKECTFALSCCY